MPGTGTALPPKGGWQVGTQVPEKRFNARRQPVDGMTVHFTTGYGVASSVWVPDATYDPATVRELIRVKVRALDQVSLLKTDGKKT